MPFRTSYNAALGQQSFNLFDVDNVQKVALGTVCKGFDPLLGEGEFIYLNGVAGCVAGDVVVYDLNPAGVTVARGVSNTFANSGRPVAFAVVPVLAGQFGWYQINGCTIANAIVGTVAGVAMLNAATGSIANTADAGDQLLGARISSAVGTPAAGKVFVTLNRPNIQSQIT